MTQKEFRDLHLHGKINVVINQFPNNAKSETDPTQDIPVKMIQFLGNGDPLNVRKLNAVFNGIFDPLKISSIEKRNTDAFDALGELQNLERKVATDIHKYKQLKKQKENEKE